MTPLRRNGFALVSAIFLLVVLTLLAGFFVTVSNTQHTSAARDLVGSRAYYAARTGIEWGSYQAMLSGCSGGTSALPSAVAATGFSVQVTCTPSGPYDEGGNQIMLYQITATATTGTLGLQDYAERQLQAVLSKCTNC